MIKRRQFFRYGLALFGLGSMPALPLAKQLSDFASGPGTNGIASSAAFSKAFFHGLVNSTFYLTASNSLGATPLRLVEVKDAEFSSSKTGQAIEQFSVHFKGTPELDVPCGTYWLENASIGRFQLYLKQSAKDLSGNFYSAHFSLVLSS